MSCTFTCTAPRNRHEIYAQPPREDDEQQPQQQQPRRSGQSAPGQQFMTHPELGTVKGFDPSAPQENVKEEIPYPVYIRPYDDELPSVTWRKNPKEQFGTLTIVKGEDKMIVKVPMKDDRILPRTQYPVEVMTMIIFFIVASFLYYILE